jgi:HEPN domain-containing protein/predicted nucleotidyltransferase
MNVMPETLATSQQVLDLITRTIVEHFRPERILLFGSRARGDTHEYSDYDILVIMDPDPSGGDQAKAIHAAFGDKKGWSMDVIVVTPAQAERKRDDVGTLVYAAEQEGRLLYARPGSRCDVGSPGAAARVRERRPGPPESLADWMHRAENDFLAVERLLRDTSPIWDTASFLSHDGAEKYLKAALVASHTRPPRSHVLGELLTICPAELQSSPGVREACATLAAVWPKTRYPGEQPEPTAAEGAEAVRAARAIRSAVLALITPGL